MHPFGVELHLQEVGRAKSEWAKANNEFNTKVDQIMNRLLHEAAAARMSPEQVAKASGYSPSRIRALMRRFGLNPKMGKTLLAEGASKALTENASLLGVDPEKMDLTSPLAYLPMGSQLKQRLEIDRINQAASKVTPEMIEAFRNAWHVADDLGDVGHRVEAGLAAALAAQS